MLCSFLNQVSPLPSIFLPSNKNLQAGSPKHPPLSSNPGRASDHPSITQQQPSHSPLLHTSNQTLLSHPKTERAQTAGTTPSTKKILQQNGSQNISQCPKRYVISPSPLVSCTLQDFLVFLSCVRTDFGCVAVPSTHTNGPVPPSNLLDKIACSVAEAKGHIEWPHSQCTTHTKIIKLTKCQARDSTPIPGITKEPGEEEELHEVPRLSSCINQRETLCHQSRIMFLPSEGPTDRFRSPKQVSQQLVDSAS